MNKIQEKLHPLLAEWVTARFTTLTEIQHRALPSTLAGNHTLILAPTGNGKTLAAFLSVISALAREAESKTGLPNSVRAVYVSPLKSLGRDMLRNLESPLHAVNVALPARRQIRFEVRTGDTANEDRTRQSRHRPHLLITTPETLTSLLSQTDWKNGGLRTKVIIVDEIHSLAENKRGSLLALTMERLEQISAEAHLQRIGLSATAWPINAITALLCGSRPCKVASIDLKRAHRLSIAVSPLDQPLPAAGYGPTRVAFTVADLVKKANCTLAFTTTRSAAERLGLALGVILPEYEDRIAVHHGSVDREKRFDIEFGLAQGTMKAVVASSSLELGVDFAAVDQVLLIGAPRGVSRALQRLGRSGHQVDGIATGSLVPLSLPDVLECIAIREGAKRGRLEALRIPQCPLDVLAQSLLGMSVERAWKMDEAFQLVRRAGPYSQLNRNDFDAVIRFLAGAGKVLGGYGPLYGKILVEDDSFRVASKRVARLYYMNIGVISEDLQVRVVARGNRRLGQVEEAFLSSLKPNEAFIIGGKTVKLKSLHQNIALVEPASGDRVKAPRWMGQRMPLSMQLATEELSLRRALRSAWDFGGPKGCRRALRKWDVTGLVADRAMQLIERQYKAAPIPVDDPVQIERVSTGKTMMLLIHVLAGRAVNRSLSWVVASRLSDGRSVEANFDDHSLLLSFDARANTSEKTIRQAFDPQNWLEDLKTAVSSTETLGRGFRAIAEIGQLLSRVTFNGKVSTKASSWNASLLYKTFLQYEPEHPLVKEAVRTVLEDECDGNRAFLEAKRIFETPFEIYDLPRPSPFALPLFSAFNRETLLAQDPDRALDDLVTRLFEEWDK